jgi:hypothetical protein
LLAHFNFLETDLVIRSKVVSLAVKEVENNIDGMVVLSAFSSYHYVKGNSPKEQTQSKYVPIMQRDRQATFEVKRSNLSGSKRDRFEKNQAKGEQKKAKALQNP